VPELSRQGILQRAINRLNARRYLEIGVDDGSLFRAIDVRERIGVDPIPPAENVVKACRKPRTAYFQMPSDEFFSKEAKRILSGGVDVVFVDGLHTFEQSYRDCVHALEYLSAGGLLFIHDCLPNSEAESVAVDNYASAKALNLPGWSGDWTGDVWKAIVRLRAAHHDLETVVFDCEHGLAAVRRAPNTSGLQLSNDQVRALTYGDLSANPQALLGLRPAGELLALIDRMPPTRHAGWWR
jgi:hypothetical protein